MEINGEHTTADIKLPEEHVEDSLQEEIQEQVDNNSFRNPVKYMPDCHGGIGPHAIVGFSMRLGSRVVPNTIGGDIGCGMTAVRLDGTDLDLDGIGDLRDLNSKVRRDVPMGTGRVNTREGDFEGLYPWHEANNKLLRLFDYLGKPTDHDSLRAYKFNIDYAEELFRRVGISEDYATDSLGSLGGGNHFIEIAEAESDGSLWVVVHSGSRNLGQKVKSYHQEMAIEERSHEIAWEEMDPESRQYAMSDGSPNWDMIKRDFNGEEIQKVGDRIESFSPDSNRNTKLDYLEGDEMFAYLRDMVFTQTYATANRRLMIEEVVNHLDAEIQESINSPHNYVDFDDGMIRKGSTRALQGEEFVVPMNMESGTLLCRGRGNPQWNFSAPHGAGRLGSRSWANSQFDSDEVRKRMYENGTYSANVPTDEVPAAYKPVDLIEKQIEQTAEIVDRLRPVVNFKA